MNFSNFDYLYKISVNFKNLKFGAYPFLKTKILPERVNLVWQSSKDVYVSEC